MIRVLTGATLIDGTGAAPVADAVIVIDGERIAAAGPRQGLSWPGDAEIGDVPGKTIIPGPLAAAPRARARGGARHGLHHDPRRRRARHRLQARHRAGADSGAAPGARDPDRLRDGGDRRPRHAP